MTHPSTPSTARQKIGIIGTGDISAAYLKAARDLRLFEVAAISDMDAGRAAARGQEFGVPVLGKEALLARADLSAVVNLTPPAAHAAVSLEILRSGHHAYSEKPLSARLEDGRALVAEAARLGLRLGCAPDTFLGAGLQTARAAIDGGLIGRPVGFTAFFMGSGPEAWHPNPAFFFQPGAGPLLDMGPYYLTALVNLLGPVARVYGAATKAHGERVAGHPSRAGERMPVDTPTHVTAQLSFASGVGGTFISSFDVQGSELPRIEIYGTEGTLSVPDPNTFGGPVRLKRAGQDSVWEALPVERPYQENARGIGLADLLSAAGRGVPHRASGDLALHVLEVMHRTLESAEQDRPLRIESTVERPAALPEVPEWLSAGMAAGMADGAAAGTGEAGAKVGA